MFTEVFMKEMNEFQVSLAYLNETVEGLKSENEKLKTANSALTNQNAALEKRARELEQYSRKNNVELKGVPCTQGEGCVAVLQAVGNRIDCPVSKDDIDIAHRVPSASDAKKLIARFTSRAKKAEFISKARKARLQTHDIGFRGAKSRPIYINDHLTQENKKLFAKALSLKKEKRWHFLWTDDCLIKARKNADSRVFRIRDEADLKIFTNQA
ncbi:hypothetical protein HPB50_016625 [Hyalomma asiaticum]|uniref:Uncharacterized protein n=1 Tax=Hyalomma asiaticum TaxID=266040 RepID=A0ACB7RV92_HYAAI|nr:hypothetical protein HPB50_016625 [Hyalomma asiaticum]